MQTLIQPIRFCLCFSRMQKLVKSLGPWALRSGSRARCMLSVFYERRWDQNLEELREELNIEPPPLILPTKSKKAASES